MGRIIGLLKVTKLQKWPYEDLKKASDKEIIDFYEKGSYIGVNYHTHQINEHNRNNTYKNIGYSISYAISIYFITWLAFILLITYVVHEIMKSRGH